MKKVLLISMVLVLGLVGNGFATTIIGSIWGPSSGLYGSDGWSDAYFSWAVTDPDQSTSGNWEYVYTFSNYSKSISHLIIQVSDEFTMENLLDGTTPFGEGDGLGWYSGDDPSNPELPALIHGIKWNTSGDPLTFTVTIVTDKEPMDGNFYAKDGQDGRGSNDKIEVVAWSGTSTGFGYNVPVPDTDDGDEQEVPEPGTLLLIGTGLLGLGLYRRGKFGK